MNELELIIIDIVKKRLAIVDNITLIKQEVFPANTSCAASWMNRYYKLIEELDEVNANLTTATNNLMLNGEK